jgi:sugar phosphate isomerase/epimerase
VSLAAATAPAATRADLIANAAAAGFGAVGLRFDLDLPDAAERRELRSRLDATGLVLLDAEVIRLGAYGDDLIRHVLDAAGELGARYVLTVSDDADLDGTVERFGRLCEDAADRGLLVALEFMRFTSVADVDAAITVVSEAAHGAGRIVVDGLHLARSGSRPADVDRIPAGRLAYVQVCDAPDMQPPHGDLAHEARHERLLAGDGALPVGELLACTGTVPVSIEVQSDARRAAHDPAALARLGYERFSPRGDG